MFDCPVCYVDGFPASEVTSVPTCKHTFCNGCWKNMLPIEVAKLRDGTIQDLRCPGVAGGSRCLQKLELKWAFDLLGEEVPADLISRAEAQQARKKTKDISPELQALYDDIDAKQRLAFQVSRGIIEKADLKVEEVWYEDEGGSTTLHWACIHENPKLIELLLEGGADKEVKNKKGETPLHVATQSGSPVAVEVLLKAGADANAKDAVGRTPLYYASRLGFAGTAAKLLDANALVESNSVQAAACYNRNALLEALLKAAKEQNFNDLDDLSGGRAPLHWAAKTRSADVCEVLLKAGANVEVQEADTGRTPLLVAAKEGSRLVAMKLVTANANVWVTDRNGLSPLAVAAAEGHVHVVKIILEHLQQAAVLAESMTSSAENDEKEGESAASSSSASAADDKAGDKTDDKEDPNAPTLQYINDAIAAAQTKHHADVIITLQNALRSYRRDEDKK